MKDQPENKEALSTSDIVIKRMQEWWKIRNEYNTEIEKEVEQRIQKRKHEEEKQKKIEEHQKLYPIGSFVEYLGLTMIIKRNIQFINNLDYILVVTEWKDKLDQIQTKTFWPIDFKDLKKVDNHES